jgi:hypothetical protein
MFVPATTSNRRFCQPRSRVICRYELAETDLTHAIAADSNNIDFLVNRSQCYYETKDFDAAVRGAVRNVVTRIEA